MVEGPAPAPGNVTPGEMPRGEMTDTSSGTIRDMVVSGILGEMPRGAMTDAGSGAMGAMSGSGVPGEMPRGEMNESTFGSMGEAELPLMEIRGDWRLILATTSVKRSN
jgi:hypothetical protein